MTASRRRPSRPPLPRRPAPEDARHRVPAQAGEEDSGTPDSRPIPPGKRAALSRLFEEVTADARRHYGRDLRPDDLLFPELEAMGEEQITDVVVQAMERAGIDPAMIYAFRKTGMLISEETLPSIPEADRREWLAAVEEYRAGED